MIELKQTDLSKRLREYASNASYRLTGDTFALLAAAADEIERYYTGMLNWKATAEAQSTQPEATKPAQDLGAAIPDGWQLVPKAVTREMQKAYFDVIDKNMPRVMKDARFGRWDSHREAYKAMLAAALASPADALVAGDRVDAERYRWLRDSTDSGRCIRAMYEDGQSHPADVDALIDAAIQAQKDGRG